MIPAPNCWKRGCKHFIGVTQPGGTEKSERITCKAFPDRIPHEIAYGDNLHTEPFEGDNGVRFEQSKCAERGLLGFQHDP